MTEETIPEAGDLAPDDGGPVTKSPDIKTHNGLLRLLRDVVSNRS